MAGTLVGIKLSPRTCLSSRDTIPIPSWGECTSLGEQGTASDFADGEYLSSYLKFHGVS